MKGIGSNYLFVKPHVDSIFILTTLELLNVVTLWLIFSLNSLTGNVDLDIAIGAILIFGLNALTKLYKQKYKIIIQKFEVKTNNIGFYNAFTIAYVLATILGFYCVHSNHFHIIY